MKRTCPSARMKNSRSGNHTRARSAKALKLPFWVEVILDKAAPISVVYFGTLYPAKGMRSNHCGAVTGELNLFRDERFSWEQSSRQPRAHLLNER